MGSHKVPSTPAQDRTTAAAPSAVRLSDGSAFYSALTDAQLRATPVVVTAAGDVAHDAVDSGNPVKVGGFASNGSHGSVAHADRVRAYFDLDGRLAVFDGGGSVTVDGPLTDAQLRATAVPVSAASLPLPTGAATQATLAALLSQYHGKTVNHFVVAQGAAGATQIAAAVVGQKHKIVGGLVTLDAEGTCKFTGASDLTGAMPWAKNGGVNWDIDVENPRMETGANEALSIVTAVGKAFGFIKYITE